MFIFRNSNMPSLALFFEADLLLFPKNMLMYSNTGNRTFKTTKICLKEKVTIYKKGTFYNF